MEMTDPVAQTSREYQQTLERASCFDLSLHGLIRCQGRDAPRFLHNLSTNDVQKLPHGAACEAFLTSAQAKIVAHAWILNLGEIQGEHVIWLDVGHGQAEKILAHLDKHLISERVELSNETANFTHVHVAGPRAVRDLAGRINVDIANLEDLRAVGFSLGSGNAYVWRRNRLGVIGYDIFLPAAAQESAIFLRELPVPRAGEQAFEWLRMEAGLPRYGIDVTEGNLPQEVDRNEQALSFTKGCYIGQETVARIQSFGHVNRTLRGLLLEGTDVPSPGSKIYREGTEVGSITSSVLSPRLARAIALGYVRRGSESPGQPVQIGAANSGLNGVISAMPFLPFVGRPA